MYEIIWQSGHTYQARQIFSQYFRYRLIILRKPLLFNILSKNLNLISRRLTVFVKKSSWGLLSAFFYPRLAVKTVHFTINSFSFLPTRNISSFSFKPNHWKNVFLSLLFWKIVQIFVGSSLLFSNQHFFHFCQLDNDNILVGKKNCWL